MSTAAEFTIEYRQYLDADANLHPQAPAFAKDLPRMVEFYKQMAWARYFDAKAIILQRTGKLGTYPSALGHEATYIGIAAAMQAEDVLGISYRESSIQLQRGVTPIEILTYWGGDERGSDFQHEPARHDFAWAVPIATQCLHAAGAALAFKIREEKRVAVCTVGDGGTSKGDFVAALNMAGARQLPLVSVIVNNQWAISVPRHLQTGATTLAQKAIAAGVETLQVDGNDIVAVHQAVHEAVERARKGNGPGVIEAITYRLGDHTTADDATRYRGKKEVEDAWKKEPMKRLRTYLEAHKAWDEKKEKSWEKECNDTMDEAINAYLESDRQPASAMFDYLYADLPEDLEAQRAEVIRLAAEEH